MSFSPICIKLCEKFPILGIGSCSQNREKKPWVTFNNRDCNNVVDITCSENEIKYVLVYYFHVDSTPVLLGGGGSITEALPGVGVQGEKSIHLRVTEEHRAQLILRGRGTLGNRENMGNKGTGTIFPPWEGLISSL